MKKVEYRVKSVTRYIVTRFEEESHDDGSESGGCEGFGEFNNFVSAYKVAFGLCKSEHDEFGVDRKDGEFIYPSPA